MIKYINVNNDKNDSILFGSNLNIKTKGKKEETNIIGKKEEGIFNQNTKVSSSINNNSLFVSNKSEEKIGNQTSLFNTNNQFYFGSNDSIQNKLINIGSFSFSNNGKGLFS